MSMRNSNGFTPYRKASIDIPKTAHTVNTTARQNSEEY